MLDSQWARQVGDRAKRLSDRVKNINWNTKNWRHINKFTDIYMKYSK
jgi:hypothetical protein